MNKSLTTSFKTSIESSRLPIAKTNLNKLSLFIVAFCDKIVCKNKVWERFLIKYGEKKSMCNLIKRADTL
jgi:hypothetical protein